MDNISHIVDSASSIRGFTFSLDVKKQDESTLHGHSQDEAQSSGFGRALTDTISLSAEALQRVRRFGENEAARTTEKDAAQKQQRDTFYASVQARAYAENAAQVETVTEDTPDVYGKNGVLRNEDTVASKTPTTEELRRVPYQSNVDMAQVAALYAGNIRPAENLQTRTFTPTNTSESYEGLRLRQMDSARPVSVHINAAQSTALAYAADAKPSTVSAAYRTQASAANPSTALVLVSRWSTGVDMRV